MEVIAHVRTSNNDRRSHQYGTFNYTYYVLNLNRPLDTSVVYDVVCQTYIHYTAEFSIFVLCSPPPAFVSLPSSAGGFILFH